MNVLSKDILARAAVPPQSSGEPALLTSTLPSSWDVTLVSPCTYTRKGWGILLSEPAMTGTLSGVTIAGSVEALPSYASLDGCTLPRSLARSLVVHLPAHPSAALLLLLQLGWVNTCLAHYHQLIVCSPFSRDVTRTALMGVGIPGVVRITQGRQPLAALYRTVVMPSPEIFFSRSWKAERLPLLPDGRLTPTELRVSATITARSVRSLAGKAELRQHKDHLHPQAQSTREAWVSGDDGFAENVFSVAP